MMPWHGGHASCLGSHGGDHHALDHHWRAFQVVMLGFGGSMVVITMENSEGLDRVQGLG